MTKKDQATLHFNVKVRKQGNSAIVSIPSTLKDILHLDPGNDEITVFWDSKNPTEIRMKKLEKKV